MLEFTKENDSDRQIGTSNNNMSLVGHLQELRRRLTICVIAVLAASSGCYFYASEIIHLIVAPAGKMYFMNPAEAFFTYLKVSVFTGFLIALPLISFEIWSFIAPALSLQERRTSIIFAPASVLLFFGGIAFSFFFVLPAGIKFFMGFATADLQPLFSLGQYLSFALAFVLPFGLIFEVPIIILIMASLGVIGSRFLIAKRKLVLVSAFVVGAIVSPTPDVFSQIMIAVPLLILYEISIIIVKYVLKK